MGYDWGKILLVAGGTATAGALVWYLLRDEPVGSKAAAGSSRAKSVAEMDKQDVLKILQEIVESQSDMSNLMKDVTEVVLKEELSFQQVYSRVKERQPQDPLEKRGLSIQDFDTLLDTHQKDDAVKQKIGEIMTAGSPGGEKKTSAGKPVPVSEIIAVHDFMCNELKELVGEYKKWDNKDAYEKKTLTIAAQAMVASRVQKSYGYTSEQIEACVLQNHNALSQDQRFTALSVQMQQTMGLLLG